MKHLSGAVQLGRPACFMARFKANSQTFASVLRTKFVITAVLICVPLHKGPEA